MISLPCTGVDSKQQLVEWVNHVLCVVAAKKVKELLFSGESILQQLEGEESSTGEGVREGLGGIREILASFIQQGEKLWRF